MKNIFILFTLLFTLSVVKAQKKQNVYFFKNNGKEVNTKDSADFVRIIQEPDSGETDFLLQEFYANGKRKMVGKVSAFEPLLVAEGMLTTFSKTGRKLSVSTYEKGKPVGMGYQYFENGKLRKQIEYTRVPLNDIQAINFSSDIDGEFLMTDNKVIYMADSLGQAYVQNGNGHALEVSKIGENERREEGDYKDGFKQGTWKSTESARMLSYTEVYEAGKFVSGESVLDGKKYPYTTKFEMAQFKGGKEAWNRYVSGMLVYPKDAAKENIMGAVVAQFTIDKDGRVKDIKITKSVHFSLDAEATRVLRQSPAWIPGKDRGVPIKVTHSQSFNFKF